MVFPGRFCEHILPESLRVLNVAFMVPELRREFGGCAGNVTWNLELLKPGMAVPMGVVGRDFAPYAEWLRKHSIDAPHLKTVVEEWTAQAFITTDMDDNQITAFHPGAMQRSHQNNVADAGLVDLAIISPDGREGMFRHADQCHDAGIPFVFDPGQGLPMFNGDELRHLTEQASWIAVNDYEWQVFSKQTGYGIEECVERLQALIVTCGGEGSVIYTKEREYRIPVAQSDEVVDPTGCGDAYRAGLLYGIAQGWDWERIGRLASVMGSFNVACAGTQNHCPSHAQINERYRAAFGADVDLSGET
ncbi:MAG: carbohydrate kinase family protein [Candidatus Eutrophobiaceae bacterium]